MVTKFELEKNKGKNPKNSVVAKTPAEKSHLLGKTDRFKNILVCLDCSHVSSSVIPYSKILAKALHASIQLVHVVEPDHDHEAPFDPVEWSLRRRKAATYLNNMAAQHQLEAGDITIAVLEGEPAAEIDSRLHNSQDEITVFCRKEGREQGHIGTTSRKLLERSSGSIFLIPELAKIPETTGFQRIMIPLDGSSRAETVLPTVSNIAQQCGSTIVLVYAVPQPDVIDISPGDATAENLRSALNEHNRSAAQRYLDRISRRLYETGVNIEKRVLAGDDARRLLIDAITAKKIDCVVVSSHGASGHADVPFGDVANHILSRSPVPILMLRDLTLSGAASFMSKLSDSSGRLPDAAAHE